MRNLFFMMAFYLAGALFASLLVVAILSDRLPALLFIWLLGWTLPAWLQEKFDHRPPASPARSNP